MAKILITAIQVNFVLIPSEAGMRQPELLLLKFLPSTYTIRAISWPPPLILQLFSHWPFLHGYAAVGLFLN